MLVPQKSRYIIHTLALPWLGTKMRTTARKSFVSSSHSSHNPSCRTANYSVSPKSPPLPPFVDPSPPCLIHCGCLEVWLKSVGKALTSKASGFIHHPVNSTENIHHPVNSTEKALTPIPSPRRQRQIHSGSHPYNMKPHQISQVQLISKPPPPTDTL